ncbi:MAG: GNAT family N-acetyltransferase [Clostridia bacterium]|jgi:GNAT superfamily N-acetyltransferase
MYIIERTKPEDLKCVMEIFSQAKAALKRMNVDQWQNGYPSDEAIISDIQNNISYVVKKDCEVVATAAIFVGNEPTYDRIFDGVWITDNDTYCVIHRIAVKENYKGQSISSDIVSFAGKMAADYNANSIRVDTHRDNMPMQKMLLKNGFIYCGIIYLNDGKERFAYEKPL